MIEVMIMYEERDEYVVTEINDLSFASTETKFIKPKTKTQNNIVIFGFFHKKLSESFSKIFSLKSTFRSVLSFIEMF